MTGAQDLRGVALLQRGAEDLVAVAGGTTGTGPDTDGTLGTRFQIASVTKQFTAAAVLLLCDRGVLSTGDPVRRWLDGAPAAWDPVTIHQLLCHTAGLVHWPDVPGLDVTRPVAASEPLGMAATFNGDPGDQPRLAAGHHDGTAVASFALDTVGLGTGSIWSTAGDLARWDRALADGEILSEAARRAMFTVHVRTEDDTADLIRTEGYGYGWFIGSVSGRRIYYHPGDNPGYRCLNAWFPDDGVRLAMLSNDDATRFDPIVDEFIRTAFRW